MPVLRKVILIITATVLFVFLFKALLHPIFLGTPAQHQTEEIPSKEEKARQFDYLKEHEQQHPPPEDIVVPPPDAAMNIAYGRKGTSSRGSSAASIEEKTSSSKSWVWHEKVNLHPLGG